jgi:hypothetical protein
MPSGYTAPIYEGKEITFAEFVLRCSRAMGAAILQRDESPDVEIREMVVADYQEQRVHDAMDELLEAEGRSDDEWAASQDEEIADAIRYRDEYLQQKRELRARYREMAEQVRAWEPPSEEHDGLKRFMLEQLEESERFDCGSLTGHYEPPVPERVEVAQYRARHLAELSKRVADARQQLVDEQNRVRSQNEWVRQLRTSLAI